MRPIYFILAALIFGCTHGPKLRSDRLSIVQGVTSAKEVEFSIVAPSKSKLRFELRSASGVIISPDEQKSVEKEHSPFVVHKVLFTKDPETEYNLYAFASDVGAPEVVVDQRLIGKGVVDPDLVKIAVASCMSDYDPSLFSIWSEVLKKNPDYLLLIGDNVYADKNEDAKAQEVTPERLWDRYVDVRMRLPIYFQQKLVPIHALWDDHDFGQNNGNSSFRHKSASREVFEAFWAQSFEQDNWSRGHGVGGLLGLGDFNLYFLDARSFRSQDISGEHLGSEQKKWLFTKLKEQPGPSFLIKGDQFFGGYHGGDSFETSHAQDFMKFNNDLAKTEAPFIFLSGDRHMSEIMQFPRGLFKMPSFEITSSPIHNGVSDKADVPNPWRVVHEKNKINFIFITNVAKDNHWFLDVESVGQEGQTLFKRELAVYIKDLQNNLQEVRKGRRRKGLRRYHRPRGKRRK
jgi:alkaline phosphatase D